MVQEKTSESPEIGVILGTGLGGLADQFNFSIPYEDLPHFPMTYLAQLASPFRWSRIERGAL